MTTPPAEDRSELDDLQFKVVMAIAEHIRCPAGQPSIVHDWPLGELMAIIKADRQQSKTAWLRRLGEKINAGMPKASDLESPLQQSWKLDGMHVASYKHGYRDAAVKALGAVHEQLEQVIAEEVSK